MNKRLNNVDDNITKVREGMEKAHKEMNQKLTSWVALDSFVKNIGHVADGLNSIAQPGLKLSSSMADLEAITGLTGQRLKEVEGYARDNARAFGGDASKASSLINYYFPNYPQK